MSVNPHTFDPTSNDYLAPEQFHDTSHPSWPKNLAFAVLEEGISSATRLKRSSTTKKGAERLQREALEWIRSDDTWHAFTFVRVCDELGLDAGTIRKAVLREGFRLKNIRAGLVTHGQSIRQTTVNLITQIDDRARRKAKRARDGRHQRGGLRNRSDAGGAQ